MAGMGLYRISLIRGKEAIIKTSFEHVPGEGMSLGRASSQPPHPTPL